MPLWQYFSAVAKHNNAQRKRKLVNESSSVRVGNEIAVDSMKSFLARDHCLVVVMVNNMPVTSSHKYGNE
jgi:hypothetical protein